MTVDDFIALCRLARLASPPPASLRNRGASLVYRPIGERGERYP